MFDSVLVANRGEIAVRIVRTLRRLGIRSIAVYSDADAIARHVAEADVAYRLGPAAAAESYLRVDRVIEAAVACGAQALHPGYGFLSEQTALAAACAEAGIVFVGPPASAIDAMGDKIRAKATVAARGVRVVPGVDGSGLSDEELAAAVVEAMDFPVLLKPSAGGGGKGMRVVADAASLPGEIAAARRAARGAFGDDTLLVEQLIERPRHIEVQVLADTHGNVVHLGERECSLQRRHQKVIEEAPSPFLDDAARAAIGAQAVEAARACGYVNAGTVEFIVPGDRPDLAYFIEMNTRLQVEHPVTEMVCGVDLVELQLRVAASEPLPFGQGDVRWDGHAIEARVYAEDARRGFLPTGGTVLALTEPEGPNVRVDSGIRTGSVVGSDYDPMLAKVIAWGTDRDHARRTLDTALADTTLLGVTSNVPFLRRILRDPDVAAGRLDTGLIERLPADDHIEADRTACVAAALASCLWPIDRRGPWADRTGWRMGGTARTRCRALLGGEPVEVVFRSIDGHGRFEVELGEHTAEVTAVLDGAALRLVVDGVTTTYTVVRSGTSTWLGAHGDSWEVVDHPLLAPGASTRRAASDTIVSPMPGSVIAVHAAVGDTVSAGQAIVVVEAMKMEHTLRAEADGTVAEVLVRAGDVVSLHQRLAVIDTGNGNGDGDGDRASNEEG